MRRSPVRRLRTLVDASWTRRAQAPDDEAGFTLVELVVAMMLITIVSTGLLVSVGLGFQNVAIARQRSIASQIASQNLEQLRDLGYKNLFLSNSVTLTNNPDPTNPDYYVNPPQYDVTGQGNYEDLIYAPVGNTSGAQHIVNPVKVGSTFMTTYVYITWVDDPSTGGTHAYKRATAVVQYHAPAAHGINQLVRASALFTPNSVTFNPPVLSTTTTTSGSPTTTTTTGATTTTTAGNCPGDTTAPTGGFTIGVPSSSQAGYTSTPNVSLNLNFTDTPNNGCKPIVANFHNEIGPSSPDVTYDPLNAQVSWTLSAGDGPKTVGGAVRDGVGNSATLANQTVYLDTIKPTTITTFFAACTSKGSTATVNLTWSPSTDLNLQGYRVYISTDGGITWSQAGITATNVITFQDTITKPNGNSTVQYKVVGYDKAGNESNSSPVVALANKDC
jgi:prepilin-type N-terminal cleavage/methylation domain-containing protein